MTVPRTITPAIVAEAYTEMRDRVREHPREALANTNQIRALASALTEDVLDLDALAEGQLVLPAHVTPADVADLLASAAATIRELVNDRETLMAAREWDIDTEAAHGIEAPSPADSEALLAALSDSGCSTGDFDRDELRAHVAWFHGVRNFVVHHKSDEQRDDQYQFDAFGLRPSMALMGLHHLMDAAQIGAIITSEDLLWATQGPERLRSDHAVAEAVPPCLRPAPDAS